MPGSGVATPYCIDVPLELLVAALVKSQVSASHFQDGLDPLTGSDIAFEGITVAE